MASMGKTKKLKKKRDWKHFIPYYLMGLPMVIYLFINNYMPLYGLLFAFKDVNMRKGVMGSPWVGLKNFEFLFRTDDNSIKGGRSSKIYQTSILLPHLMSMVVVSYIVYAFLDQNSGIFNALLTAFGGEGVNWYADAGKWPFILIFVNQWYSIGFSSIIYLSSICGISQEYYEAAELDGASKWQQITQITLPLLKGTIIMMTIMGLGRMFRSDFGLFYQVPMNTGALYSTTQTIDTYVFRGLMQLGNFGMSAAAGFYQSIVGFILVVTANTVIKKISAEDALF